MYMMKRTMTPIRNAVNNTAITIVPVEELEEEGEEDEGEDEGDELLSFLEASALINVSN